MELYAKIRHAVMISTTPACPAELNEAETLHRRRHPKPAPAGEPGVTMTIQPIAGRQPGQPCRWRSQFKEPTMTDHWSCANLQADRIRSINDWKRRKSSGSA